MANSRSHILKNLSSIAAAGTTIADATIMPAVPTVAVVTVSASTRGVRLPSGAVPGQEHRIINETAFNVKVWPATGDAIGAAATNANSTITAQTGDLYVKGASNRWRVI